MRSKLGCESFCHPPVLNGQTERIQPKESSGWNESNIYQNLFSVWVMGGNVEMIKMANFDFVCSEFWISPFKSWGKNCHDQQITNKNVTTNFTEHFPKVIRQTGGLPRPRWKFQSFSIDKKWPRRPRCCPPQLLIRRWSHHVHHKSEQQFTHVYTLYPTMNSIL